jgi:hypothetical protein
MHILILDMSFLLLPIHHPLGLFLIFIFIVFEMVKVVIFGCRTFGLYSWILFMPIPILVLVFLLIAILVFVLLLILLLIILLMSMLPILLVLVHPLIETIIVRLVNADIQFFLNLLFLFLVLAGIHSIHCWNKNYFDFIYYIKYSELFSKINFILGSVIIIIVSILRIKLWKILKMQ